MNINRTFITTSNEVRGVNIGKQHFPRFLSSNHNSFFDGDSFDAAVWGNWSGDTWNYQGFIKGDNGLLAEDEEVRGQIPFLSRVADGANGNVNVTQFMGTYLGGAPFKGPGVPILTNMASPLFAIVDHNSAHHITLPLAIKAFSAHFGTGGWNRSIVINLDAHEDFHGRQTWKEARCQNWGRLLIQKQQRPQWIRGYTIDTYAVFGLRGGGDIRAKSWRKDGQTATSNDASLQPNGNARLTGGVLNRILGNLTNASVYITIDRDFMAGSDTPYGDGSYQAREGRRMMSDLFAYLKASNVPIVGVDITGLPVEGRHYGRSDQGNRNSLKQAAEDILHLYRETVAY